MPLQADIVGPTRELQAAPQNSDPGGASSQERQFDGENAPVGLSSAEWADIKQQVAADQFLSSPDQDYLKASNTAADDLFGYSVAVSGQTVVVGAFQEDSNSKNIDGDESNNSAKDAGAAYVFTRNNGVWTQQAYLKPANTGKGDFFGYSVAISGDLLVVGAPKEDSDATTVDGDDTNDLATYSGAAYVFARSNGNWSQQAYLKAFNSGAGDQFGFSVGISGQSVVVSAPFEDSDATGVNGDGDSNMASSAGAAYVFTNTTGAWVQQAYLKASNAQAADAFGYTVAISGDTIVIGAPREDSGASGINGDESDNSTSYAGAAYVFHRSAGNWSQQAYLKASNSELNDEFGRAVAISADTVVVGAYGEDSNAMGANGDQSNNSKSDSGAVYVFTRSGANWSQQAYVKASNTAAGDQFGYSVAISGEALLVGAWREASNATGVDGDQGNNSFPYAGAAYLFLRSGDAWSQQSYLKASNTGNSDFFGHSVGVSGQILAAGAYGEDSDSVGVGSDGSNNLAVDAGAAYAFDFGESDTDERTVGGTVNGLSGFGLVLQNNGSDELTIFDNGSFTFNSPLIDGASYSVGVLAQPSNPDQTCSVVNGSGTVSGDVTNVQVQCVTATYFVAGSVEGLVGNGLVIQNNGGDNLPLDNDGPFVFDTPLAAGSSYNVTVLHQPTSPGQNCSVTNGQGTLSGDVIDVQVACIPFTVNVDATDGMFPDKVRVLWEEAGSETHYSVYRCNDATPSDCVFLSNIGAGVTRYDDLDAPPDGQVYFYTVKVCNTVGCTNFAPPDTGNRLGYPTGLSATDGVFEDMVRLSWNDVIGESYYEVYRCPTASLDSCGSPIDSVAAGSQSYEDFAATGDGTTHYYRLRSCNANGCSVHSPADAGHIEAPQVDDVIFSSNFE